MDALEHSWRFVTWPILDAREEASGNWRKDGERGYAEVIHCGHSDFLVSFDLLEVIESHLLKSVPPWMTLSSLLDMTLDDSEKYGCYFLLPSASCCEVSSG